MHNYELALMQQFKCLHPIFCGNKLVPHFSDPNPLHIPPPPPPVQLEGTDKWEINQILDSKRVGRGVRYLIDWKGYGPEERTWEPLSSLNNSVESVLEYHKTNPTNISPSPSILRKFLEWNGVSNLNP